MKKTNLKDKQYSFFEDVFAVVRLIPKGRVTSYGAIANYLQARGMARMVGYAMNQSHTASPKVPAHRVVNAKGELSGRHHFPTPTAMQERLLREGIQVQNEKVVEFKTLFWDPAVELDIGDLWQNIILPRS